MSTEEIDDLSVEDILEMAAGVIDRVVVRDAGLLAAAAARPRISVFGDDAYPALDDKAAALLAPDQLLGAHRSSSCQRWATTRPCHGSAVRATASQAYSSPEAGAGMMAFLARQPAPWAPLM